MVSQNPLPALDHPLWIAVFLVLAILGSISPLIRMEVWTQTVFAGFDDCAIASEEGVPLG